MLLRTHFENFPRVCFFQGFANEHDLRPHSDFTSLAGFADAAMVTKVFQAPATLFADTVLNYRQLCARGCLGPKAETIFAPAFGWWSGTARTAGASGLRDECAFCRYGVVGERRHCAGNFHAPETGLFIICPRCESHALKMMPFFISKGILQISRCRL